MVFRVEDGHGAQALDINEYLNRLRGYGVISGGTVQAGSGQYAIEVEATSVYLTGDRHEISATELDLDPYVADANPRKVAVYVDGTGSLVIAPGEPESPQPDDQYRFQTFRPAPPDLSSTDGVVLAEVWVSPDDNRITENDIRNRSLDAALSAYSLDVHSVDIDEITDGAGVTHTGELASGEEIPTHEDIREFINTDTDHGNTASHNYFSGSHGDLTGIQSGQHHPRYQPEESREAVRGSVAISELTAGNGSSGQHIEANGSGAVWVDPPEQQADVISTGTVTHTGGSSTTVLLAGITTDETALFDVAVGVSSDPSWSGDYAYSIDATRQWNDSAGEVDVQLTISWSTDPGSGNDLSLSWSAYETSPVVVEGRYTDADTIQGIDGATIEPSSTNVADRLNAPVYDDISSLTGMETGDLVVGSGDGASKFGQYIYDGSEWKGPVGTSVQTLSDLNIDVSRSWNGYSILDVGAPENPTDVAREKEITDHAATSDVHHSKTTSSDIDHQNISNIQSGQHHPRYSDGEAVNAAAGTVLTSSLTGASVPGGQYLQNFHYLQSGEELTLLRVEVCDEDGDLPNGVEIQLYDRTNDTVVYSNSSFVASGTQSSPLATLDGTEEVAIRIYNGSGSEVALSGTASFLVQ